MNHIKKLVFSGVCLAMCMILPLFTGQIPEIGSVLSPMHIPVLICGFICGWPYGLAVGFVAPFLRFMIFAMPPILPVGTAMAFELAAYGLISGMLYKLTPKKNIYLYFTLIISMFAGRVVWGIAMLIISAIIRSEFTWAIFISGAFTKAVPGIIVHIVLIPIVVIALKKAGLMCNE